MISGNRSPPSLPRRDVAKPREPDQWHGLNHCARGYWGDQIRRIIKVMSALALSCLIFVLTLGGIFLGALLRRALPKDHLSKESQDVVRLGTGLIGTIAALVLGLLIAAAKSSFD